MKKQPYVKYVGSSEELSNSIYLPTSGCHVSSYEFLKGLLKQVQALHEVNEKYVGVQYFDGTEIKEIDTDEALRLVAKYVCDHRQN
jgi:hypothetical protein